MFHVLSGWSSVIAGAALVAGCAGGNAEGAAAEEPSVVAYQQAATGLRAPAGCTELDAGEFKNGIQLTPVMYERSPTFRAATTALGDPAVTDSLRIRLDADTGPGVYSLTGDNSDLFTCEQCVSALADSLSAGLFVADSGTLAVAAVLSREQSIGVLFDVTLRQAVAAPPLNAPYGGSDFVPGGSCFWIRFATWNTIRPFGCSPEAGSLTSRIPGHTCVADSRAANDGTLQRSAGRRTQGEACTLTPATATAPAASECARGFACTNAFTDTTACMKTCDFMAADPGCGAGLVCGVQGLCAEQAVLEPLGFAFDAAQIGAACAVDFAEFCGREGARGVCVGLTGTGSGRCYPYRRARSQCAVGEELGFVTYPLAGGGFDRTYGFCFPR